MSTYYVDVVSSHSKRGRFPGLTLKKVDRAELRSREHGSKHHRIDWIRIRALLLLDQGHLVSEVAQTLGTYPRTIRRVGWRYLDGGLGHALEQAPRTKEKPMLSAPQEAEIVAMVCSKPPDGKSRWTLVLLAREARGRNIVVQVSRETIRKLLHDHDIKPWRKKMWCVPHLDQTYLARMENLLELYERPLDSKQPVVCLDERPVQLLDSKREGKPMRPGRVEQQDYKYTRCGTANIFCIVEPKRGVHLTHASPRRTAKEFAEAMRVIANR